MKQKALHPFCIFYWCACLCVARHILPCRAGSSAHLSQVVLLVQQRPPLLSLAHEGAQPRSGEGHRRRGPGARRPLLGQPWALQAAGGAGPAPGAVSRSRAGGWRDGTGAGHGARPPGQASSVGSELSGAAEVGAGRGGAGPVGGAHAGLLTKAVRTVRSLER